MGKVEGKERKGKRGEIDDWISERGRRGEREEGEEKWSEIRAKGGGGYGQGRRKGEEER